MKREKPSSSDPVGKIVFDLSGTASLDRKQCVSIMHQISTSYSRIKNAEMPFSLGFSGVDTDSGLWQALLKINADKWPVTIAEGTSDVVEEGTVLLCPSAASVVHNLEPSSTIVVPVASTACGRANSGAVMRLPLAEGLGYSLGGEMKLNHTVEALVRHRETGCWAQAAHSAVPASLQRTRIVNSAQGFRDRGPSGAGVLQVLYSPQPPEPAAVGPPVTPGTEPPLVSALCVSNLHSMALLARAVTCWGDQSHPNKELVLVYDESHPNAAEVSERWGATPGVTLCGVDESDKTLGDLRNHSVQAADQLTFKFPKC